MMMMLDCYSPVSALLLFLVDPHATDAGCLLQAHRAAVNVQEAQAPTVAGDTLTAQHAARGHGAGAATRRVRHALPAGRPREMPLVATSVQEDGTPLQVRVACSRDVPMARVSERV